MPNGFVNGNIVSIPCEIKPGMSSFERYVRINAEPERITGFVNRSSIIEDPTADSDPARVKAVIVVFSKADMRLLFAGQDIYPSNPAPISVTWLGKHGQLLTK
jgi:hypothetical protein